MSAKARSTNAHDLSELVERGQEGAYEALQLFKSRASRLVNKGQYAQAVHEYLEGAKALMDNNFCAEGHELALEALKTLQTQQTKVMVDMRASLMRIIEAYNETSLQLQYECISSAIEWSKLCGERYYGDPIFHLRAAECTWKQGLHNKALRHFALAEAPQTTCSTILSTIHGKLERDAALAKAVLYTLSFENLRDGNAILDAFEQEMEKEHVMYEVPLLTFIRQLLLTCERDAPQLFRRLCEECDPLIQDDQMHTVSVT
jgi:hypothetical protein